MEYWICYKHGKYIKDIDRDGNLVLTRNAKEAHKFYKFEAAMQFFGDGFAVYKNYF